MYVGGILLIAKNNLLLVILKGLLGNYGCKYIILMKTHLKRDMTGLFLLPTLHDLKTDANHLLQGKHSSSSLSTQFSKFYHGMNVQSIQV